MSPEAFEESVMPFDWRRLIYMHTGWRIRRNKLFSNQRNKKAEEKPGRNDPCQCGSGKKFKQCCLH